MPHRLRCYFVPPQEGSHAKRRYVEKEKQDKGNPAEVQKLQILLTQKERRIKDLEEQLRTAVLPVCAFSPSLGR